MKSVCVVLMLLLCVGCGTDHTEKIDDLEKQIKAISEKNSELEKQILFTAKTASEWDKLIATAAQEKLIMALNKLREEDKDNLEMVGSTLEAQQNLLSDIASQVTKNTKLIPEVAKQIEERNRKEADEMFERIKF